MKDRISKLIALGAASEVQMDELGFEGVVAAKSAGPQVVTCAQEVQRVGDRYRFLLSTETPDRRGDIVRQSGLDLTHYKKNNVVLLNHDDSLPIGVAELSIDGARTWMDVQFSEANPMGRVVRGMTEEGTLKAASISILPKKVDPVREKERRESLGLGKYGVVYEGAEVLEGSVVTLPMNAEAVRSSLQIGVEKGLYSAEEAEQFERAAKPTERDLMKRCGIVETPEATVSWTLNGISNSGVLQPEPAWVARLEKTMADAAARMERAVAGLNVKQAAVSGADGARATAAEASTPGNARPTYLSRILDGLEAREREGN